MPITAVGRAPIKLCKWICDVSRRQYSRCNDLQRPSGRVIAGPPPGNYWRVKESKFKEWDAEGRIWWGEDGNNVPAIKRYLSEVKQGRTPQTMWFYDEVGHTQDAKKTLLEMGVLKDQESTITPKPVALLERILELASEPGPGAVFSLALPVLR